MISYCIISLSKKAREEEAEKVCRGLKIDPLDVTVLHTGTNVKKEQTSSIGIDAIKTLQKTIYLSPLKGDQKAVIIHNGELLTTEAQNALLKILEEPPPQTTIFLTTFSKDALLPTVLSRCVFIEIITEKASLSEEDEKTFSHFLASLTTFRLCDALEYAERVSRDKNQAQEWFHGCMLTLHRLLIDQATMDIKTIRRTSFYLRTVQDALLQARTTNVHLRLLSEHVFLSFVQYA